MTVSECPNCHVKFQHDRRKVYCSKECRRGKKDPVTVNCTWCGKTFRSTSSRGVYCCDSCAISFISEGFDSGKLFRKGVVHVRAKKLGWKPVEEECSFCHVKFVPKAGIHNKDGKNYCYKEPCISSTFKGRRKTICKMYEKKEGESACKVVICSSVDKYRDVMLEAFPGAMRVDDFDETKRIVMSVACKDYVHPKSFAVSIFMMTLARLSRAMPCSQDRLARSVGTSSISARGYVKKYGHLVPGVHVHEKGKRST